MRSLHETRSSSLVPKLCLTLTDLLLSIFAYSLLNWVFLISLQNSIHYAVFQMPASAVNSVVVQTSTIVNQTVNQNTTNTIVLSKKKKKKKSIKEKKPRPKPGEIRLTTALGKELHL